MKVAVIQVGSTDSWFDTTNCTKKQQCMIILSLFRDTLSSFISWLLALAGRLENVLFENEKQCACLCPTLATVA